MAHDLVLCDMPRMLGLLHDEVDRAHTRVWIESYIFASDDFGRSFAERLCGAVERGVDARVLYDPLGSQKAEPTFFEEMCGRGVKFRPYRPLWVSLGSLKLAPRDHGRIFLVDETAAYTGGAAWAKQWAPHGLGGDGWHDINIRVAGPVVADFAALFEQRWGEADGKGHPPRDFDTGSRHADLRLVGDTPRKDLSLVYEEHYQRMQRARERIWMANAYFLPPPPMLRALFEAAARGVDVRVIVPGETDLPILQRAARSEYAHWMEGGVAIYEYQDAIMHAKYAVIDDDWCTVGTFNANSTSLGAANEIGVFVFRSDFVSRCADQFEADQSRSRRVTKEMASDRSFIGQAIDQAASDAFALLDMLVGPNDPSR
jgi:cardiolipin synthase A/B